MVQPFGRCRVCGSTDLQFLFSIGEQYLNDFVEPGYEYSGTKYPIELELCNDCTLVQLRHTAPQELLYSRHYWYRSGVTHTMRTHLRDTVGSCLNLVSTWEGDVFLDIGSNDGTLLRNVPSHLHRVGVEPAINLAEEGAEGVDCFINNFWSADVYGRHVRRPAKIVTALGMFYDLDDPNKFIGDVAEVLAEDGMFVAQLMCLRNMLDQRDVGNLTHEHLEFYSLRSLERLLGTHGLEIMDIEHNRVNGGSYRLYCRHAGSKVEPFMYADHRVGNVRAMEQGLDEPRTYRLFLRELERTKDVVYEFIEGEYCRGRRTWVYGASTKGNVLLQYYRLDKRLVQGAAERSPEKWGRVTIGTGIPIVSEEEARKARPDYFLVLPYAFLDEFVDREREWLHAGGRFVVPLPEPRIVGCRNGVVTEVPL